MIVNKRKYVPDLNEYMAQCEMNYVLLARLLRLLSSQKSQAKDIESNDIDHSANFSLTILDEARYTTTLLMTVMLSDSDWIEPVELKVRMYHDASMVEVLEPERNHAPKPKHDYPNQVAHYPDDKHQRNHLLQQSLRACLEQCANQVVVPFIAAAKGRTQ